MDLLSLLQQHGYLVLFFAMLVELIAVPVPGELLMSSCGLLVYEGHMNWIGSILLAWIGCCIGITISYCIGKKVGPPFFEKYGRRLHLGPERIEKTSYWFQRYGNKVLIVGYFIPGVRHITGYVAGITSIPFRTFAGFAYTGALLYTGIFISLGKFLGPKWEQYHLLIKKYLLIAGISAAVVLLIVYLYRRYRVQILDWAIDTFKSLGRVRVFVIGTGVVFLALAAVMAGMIQDFWAQEFQEFDAITMYLVKEIFADIWLPWMGIVPVVASYGVMIPAVALTLLWVSRRSQNARLDALFLLVVLFGGEVLEEALRRFFHRATFPSEQALMVLAVYGGIAFLWLRYSGRAGVRTLISAGVLLVALFVGGLEVYLGSQLPSDVVAGFVFGGVWLSLNIVLVELLRATSWKKSPRV